MLHREFCTKNGEGRPYPLEADDTHELAKAAALLLEATHKCVGDDDEATAQVRISNLEAMNDNLRVNNEALRKANATLTESLEKMANPMRVVTIAEPSK